MCVLYIMELIIVVVDEAVVVYLILPLCSSRVTFSA
jgi:hypothetical protein